MAAFKDGSGGVAVMTNSDGGGPLAREIILSVAREYGWPGLQPTEKVVALLSDAALAALAGTYRIEGFGDVEITAEDGSLWATAEAFDEPRELLPENDLEFFTRDDGTPVRFESDGERAGAIVVAGGARGVRVN